MFSKLAYSVFEQSIKDYHQFDNVDQPINNPFPKDQFEHLLYLKNWIDTVQWHFEDIIRDQISILLLLALKEELTLLIRNVLIWWSILMVIFAKYSDVKVKDNAKSTQKVLLGLLTGYRY
jgi:hypothetical protein